jgi:CelD/BcsL family acetyltransferase involved in cellulose biosynthesis
VDLAGTPLVSRPARALRTLQRAGDDLRLLPMSALTDQGFVEGWTRLAENASLPNPFYEPWFLLPSIEHLLDTGHAKLAALYRGGELVGLLPLVFSLRYYGYPIPHRAAWLHDNAFCGAPFVKAGAERQFWPALFKTLDRAPGAGLFLHLPQMPAGTDIDRALGACLEATGRDHFISQQGERAMLASPLHPDEYLSQAMSGKKRKELRRQRKLLSQQGELRVERLEGTQKIEIWIDDFLAIEASGWKGEAGSALSCTEATRRFFAQTARGAAQAGRLERLSLTLDGNPIAMLASFVTPPGAFSFKTTFDERFARHSPGLLLQLENLAMLEHPQVDWTDSCAAPGHSMIERIWREKRTIVSRNIAIGGAARRAAFKALMALENRKRSEL